MIEPTVPHDTGAPDCVRICARAPSRLHFGLLGWGPDARRQFGGVGLMVQAPGLELEIESAESWRFEGALVERSRRTVDDVLARWDLPAEPPAPAVIRVARAPRPHVGLGVGTQLALAVASVLAYRAGLSDLDAEALARLTGRGRRSGIGLHGFLQGGLIVDGGRKSDEGFPPLLARAPFPTDWSIVIVEPPAAPGLHGAEESRAFSQLPPVPEPITDRLCQIVLLGALPAVHERDLDAFGAALSEMQAHVGASFAPAQGGPYAAPQARGLIAELKRAGLLGIGQSSWGPTLYAFSDRDVEEVERMAERLRERCNLGPDRLFVTHADNDGARISTDG